MLETTPQLEAVTDALAVPHSREAEEAVLGSILINFEVFADVSAFLSADDFYIFRHKMIWDAMESLHSKKIPMDLLTISTELEESGVLQEVGGPAYLTSLVNQVPTSLNAEAYGHIVEGFSVRRKMIEAANNLAKAAYMDKGKPVAELLDAASAQLLNLQTRSVQDKQSMTLGEALGVQYDRMQTIAEHGRPLSIPTGFYDLDQYLHGLHNQDFILVATLPGKGKSALLQSMAVMIAKDHGKAVGIFSPEMTAVQVANRMISIHKRMHGNDLRDGLLTAEEWATFVHGMDEMSGWNVTIDETPAITPERLFAKARRLRERGLLDVLMVDYVQIMGVSEKFGYGKNRNREQEVSHMARLLKYTARELDIPVIAAAQVNRAVAARADKRLGITDLRESGALEQEADVICFIQPEKEEVKAPSKIVDVEIAKQRNGPVGTVQMLFEGEFTGFRNLRKEDERRNWWETE